MPQFTLAISPEGLAKIQAEREARRRDHPILSRLHPAREAWPITIAATGPAVYFAIPANLWAQRRGEKVGFYTISQSRELLIVAICGAVMWFFIGAWLDQVLRAVFHEPLPPLRWLEVGLASFLVLGAGLPFVLTVIDFFQMDKLPGEDRFLSWIAVGWFALSLSVFATRFIQFNRWRKQRRARSLS